MASTLMNLERQTAAMGIAECSARGRWVVGGSQAGHTYVGGTLPHSHTLPHCPCMGEPGSWPRQDPVI